MVKPMGNLKKANTCFRRKKIDLAEKYYRDSIREGGKAGYVGLIFMYFSTKSYEKARGVLFEFSSEYDSEVIARLVPKKICDQLGFDIYRSNQATKSSFSLSQLVDKLWGGFSRHAEKDLVSFVRDKKVLTRDRAKGYFVLARWYAVHLDWDQVFVFIDEIKKIDKGFYRIKKVKLLLIESLIATGNYDKAYTMIDYVLSRKFDSDFLCALSNLRRAQFGILSDDRLNAVNTIYEHKKLEPIRLIDPRKGFVFGNISYRSLVTKISQEVKISVLVPVYNAEEFVDVAIHSLLNQSWQNIEIIAIDDCSTDKSLEKLNELSKADSRLKVYRNDENLGAYPTRNRALSLSTGDFITVHDSDDWSHPQMLEVQMNAMFENNAIKISCSFMTRVYPDLRFMLRPQRDNFEYVHRSYPSVLIKRSDIELLGQWDGVSANADDEFVQRARRLWGDDSVVDVLKEIPLSFFLVHENSLTQQAGTSLNSVTFGIRKEYARQAAYWRDNKKTELVIAERTSLKLPFPIPQGLAPKSWSKNNHYDFVLISDLSLLGGTRRCNEGYIAAALKMNWRIGLFHWPRYDLKVAKVADEYTELSYHDNIDILVPEDKIVANIVIIHHPPILNYEIDRVPEIEVDKIGILVNQSPMQLWSQEPFYYFPEHVESMIERLFGRKPIWIPISPRVEETLALSGGYEDVYSSCWYPPYSGNLPVHCPDLPNGFGSQRKIRIGRHSRNHWTKWPSNIDVLRQAYCVNSPNITVCLLGGAETPKKLLGKIPDNWEVLEFDSVDVKDFVNDLDFFIHYTHPEYIEEFGRNIMEAMAAGRVVILPYDYEDIFGEAAVYAEAGDVLSVVQRYWSSEVIYIEQAERGFRFVKEKCSLENVQKNLERFGVIR